MNERVTELMAAGWAPYCAQARADRFGIEAMQPTAAAIAWQPQPLRQDHKPDKQRILK